jgi:hypothetical protein
MGWKSLLIITADQQLTFGADVEIVKNLRSGINRVLGRKVKVKNEMSFFHC